ncbi:L-fuconolactone hydrolase [Marinobacterium lacunae]|uniref:L-fuconolactone hydrolase n=1 Tax=Marinobacterium lacunae TaxID=1232683 RepID=A0A081FZK3_9GAMM|nr:amidohydrolase family protein [Marinobacterium lacunae]KEA63958.1 L-fuconolactone hydrolase [Marinobacterium lacunae]
MDLNLTELRSRYLQSGEDKWLPIVDAHLHFWDPQQNYHPWLCDEPPITFRYGDYRPIRKPFLPADYRALQGEHRVIGTVYMEAEWDPTDAPGEADWVHGLAQRTGWPNAMIGQAWLDRADVAQQLEALAQFPRLRGVRHKPAALAREDYDPAHCLSGSMRCPNWQRGYAALAQQGLICELQTHWWHLPDLLPLLERYPEVPVVINHTGVPGQRDEATLQGWHQAMARLAAYPQVSVKISGLGMQGRRWRLDDNQRVIQEVIALFGPQRCLFASNFPVDSLVTDLAPLWGAFKQLTTEFSRTERLAMFCDNAIRIYQLDCAELGETTEMAC